MAIFSMSPQSANSYRDTTDSQIRQQGDRPCVTSPGKRRCRTCHAYKAILGAKLKGGFQCADCVKAEAKGEPHGSA